VNEKLVFDRYPFPKDRHPSSWAIVSIGQIAKLVASGFPSGQHNQEARGVPHIRPMNIDRDGRLDLNFLKYVEGDIPRELAKGDVLFNNTNSPELIGKTTAVLVDTRLAYSNHMTRLRLEQGLNPSFIARQLHFLWMCGYFRHRCVNHVNQASISADPLSETVPILLPPPGEQERIADALDELLSDIDAGVAALERVREKLKLYRAAVLKAAVEGVLTAEWRKQYPQAEPASELLKRILAERRRRWEEEQLRKFKEKGRAPAKNWKAKYKEPVVPDTTNLPRLPEGWCWASFDQIGETQGGLQKSPSREPLKNHYPYLRVANVHRGSLDLRELQRFELTNEELGRLRLQPGDLLIVEGNGSRTEIGRCALWTGEVEDCVHQNHIIRVRPLPGIVPKFADLFMNSPTGQLAIQHAASSTSGLYTLSIAKIERLPIALPSEAEQEAITESVEDQFSIIDHLESDLNAKVKNAQALRQSILRHAFSGELVPQDLNDEPASELLKRIASAREQRAQEGAAAKRLSRLKRRRAPKPRGKAAHAAIKENQHGRIADR
jgi:type I restriction enzyme S subunit